MRGGVTTPSIHPATFADLIWPTGAGRALSVLRGLALVFAGACLLTLSAKVAVPGPVPMTLQTAAVLALGALLGMRLAFLSVCLYLLEGALGLPVFANTPPLTAGIPYLLGPTGGFLAGFALAAALVGFAADRGAMARPVLFALALIAAEAVMFGMGFLWLAFFAPIGTAVGLGAAKAWAVGIQPFLLGDAIKVALVATTLPLVWGALGRR